MTPNVPGPDPIEQAAATLLRAAELMERTERLNADRARDAANAGWGMLQARAGLHDQNRSLRGQADLAGTAGGQQLLVQQVALRGEMGVHQQRLALAQSQAEQTRLGTAGGVDDFRQQTLLSLQRDQVNMATRRRQQELQEQVTKQYNIDQFGLLGGTVANATADFRKLSPAIAIAQRAFGTISGLVSVAAPNTAATFDASIRTIQARLGTFFVPLMESLRAGAQGVSRRIAETPPSLLQTVQRSFVPGGAAGGILQDLGLGASLRQLIRPEQPSRFGNAVRGALDPTGLFGGLANFALGGNIDRSGGGLAQPRIGTGESYYREAQMQILSQGPEDLKTLAEQMANLERSLTPLLQQVAENTAPLRDSFPAFR